MELTGGSDPAPEATPEVTPEVTPEEAPVEETPSPEATPEEAAPEAAVEEEEAPADAVPEEVLYETPDGRKVNAETLQKEWKENFLPDYTRKSQALAEIEREKNINNPPKDEKPWEKPDYVPKDYAEVIEIAKAEAVADMQKSAQEKVAHEQAIKTQVEEELSGLKAKDPKLDENSLFQHANKYGFQSLTTAYQNMSDMKQTALNVEQRTVKNIKEREADPISTTPGGEVAESTGYDPGEMSQYDGAAEYLAHVKGKQ